MDLKTGDRVVAESESTERPPRFGVVEEVLVRSRFPASASAGMTDTRASTRRRPAPSGARPAARGIDPSLPAERRARTRTGKVGPAGAGPRLCALPARIRIA